MSLRCCCSIGMRAALWCAVLWDGAVCLCQSCCCEAGHHGFFGVMQVVALIIRK
ncbi:hypothetical protein XF_0971 [Xylella fastidiosa 9a5c]|uniref:Uncharacterized protein n=1 Tax=Xylella fastidiosa (strain 9a5c) TaxID=160492 RepID=Q9PEQ7_XYLFA|nr:hypothetical protein XF_0971 [Xylella fastidiosa 9a5c]